MAGASWYRHNTVTVTTGSVAVVGVGTSFMAQVSIGDLFTVDGTKIYEIATVVDDTHLMLQATYTGVTGTVAYGILRNFTTTTNASLAAQLTALLGSWQTREDQQRTWLAGALLSGYRSNGVAADPPGNDPLAGYYPMADAVGVTRYIPCPALFTNATKLQGFTASQTPAENNIVVVKADGSVVLPGVVQVTPAAYGAGLLLNSPSGNTSGQLAIGVWSEDLCFLQAQDNISARDLAINPNGGAVLFGATINNGSGAKVQVVGDATVKGILRVMPSDGSDTQLFVQNTGTTYRINVLNMASSQARHLVLQEFAGGTSNLLVGSAVDNSSGAKLQVAGAISATTSFSGTGTATRFSSRIISGIAFDTSTRLVWAIPINVDAVYLVAVSCQNTAGIKATAIITVSTGSGSALMDVLTTSNMTLSLSGANLQWSNTIGGATASLSVLRLC